jgi:hypothetical protein
VTVPSGSSTHSQCIYVAGTQGMTVRRSYFYNCAIFDIFQSGDVDTTTDMVIENNVFEAPRLQGGDCCAYFTVRFAWGIPERVELRNNSSEHQMDFRLGAIASKVVGNTIQSGIACAHGVRFSHNVVTKTDPCSRSDRRVRRIGYRNPDKHDFDLVSGSPAIDAGDPADHPATDIDGLGRRGAPDAGAHEFNGVRGGSSPRPVHRRTGGLVGAWGFNETSGRLAADRSGRGNSGRIFGAARVAGRFGRALHFDGTGDFVAVRDSASLDFKHGMTLEAWVKPTSGPRHWRPVIVKQRKRGAAYGLFTAGRNGRASARLRTTRTGKLSGRPARGGGAWKHLAATWNGKVMRLYVNGRPAGKKRLSKRAAKSAGRLLIGGSRGGSFKGVIDEVRIYRRALSASQIRHDRATPIG